MANKLAVLIGLAAIVATTIQSCQAAVVRITDDRGGNIGAYWSRYTAIRDNNDQVIIDGTCSSACTLVLGIVPARRICITTKARLGFHAAWRPGFLGLQVINDPATHALMSFYPVPVRQWIVRNGGLGDTMIYLYARDLVGLYRQCR